MVRRYVKAADSFGKAAARQHAAHVAAWLAYGPPGYTPSTEELQLLTTLLNKFGNGLLPSRLQKVLPAAQAAMKQFAAAASLDGEGGQAWEQAFNALKKRLRKFQCCRKNEQWPSDHDEGVRNASQEALQAMPSRPATQATLAAPSPQHAGLQQLFRKVNEWTNMEGTDRAECLRHAEVVAAARKAITPAKLTEVLCQVAAALSPPRKSTIVQADPAEQDAQEAQLGAGAEELAPSRDLQHRARKLLLKALTAWRSHGFDCDAIRHILEHVQRQIRDFEQRAGQLHLAASAKVWLAIQKAIQRLLTQASQKSEESLGATVQRRRMVQRQSNFVARGAKKIAMVAAMEALGGKATHQQLLNYVRRNPSFQQDRGAMERSLKSFRASAYFEVCGRRNGEHLYRFAGHCPRGIRRQKHGFTARMQVRSSACCCVGPLRSTVEEAGKDYQLLKKWRTSMPDEMLIRRIRGWQDAHVVSSRQKPREHARGRKTAMQHTFVSF